MEFSKNGVFHNEIVVITFHNYRNGRTIFHRVTPVLQTIYRNQVNQIHKKIVLTKILESKPI